MAQYKLKIGFTNEQLQTIYTAGVNVVVAKPSIGGSTPNVAWQVFRPMQANTLEWAEEYGIYASTSQVANGANLTQLSSTGIPAAMNKLYCLEPNSIISGPSSGGSPDSYALLNKYDQKSVMTIGLYQDANVNGTEILGNAVSAVPVMLQSTAVMTPYTTIYIWLQSSVISNTVCTIVTSPMTELRFGGGTSEIGVAYDSQSGLFLKAGYEHGDGKELIFFHNPLL